MEFLGRVAEWFAEPARWTGSEGIPARLGEHVGMSALSVSVAAAVAVPLGLLIGHTRRFELVAVSAANLGRAIPSLAILGFAFVILLPWGAAFGVWPTAIALVLLAIPPILTNTVAGIRSVDPDAVEAARGMGMTGMEVVRRIEVPLATPLIVAGLRTAAVQVVATATLAALVAWGGLGRFIIDGFAVGDRPRIFGGAVLVAGLALLTEAAFAVLERRVRPRTSSARTGMPAWPPRLPQKAA